MKSTVIIIYNEYMSLHTYTGESKYTFLVSISIKVFSFWTKYPNFYIKQLLCNNYIKQVYDITHNSLIHPVATNAIKECVITRILQRNRDIRKSSISFPGGTSLAALHFLSTMYLGQLFLFAAVIYSTFSLHTVVYMSPVEIKCQLHSFFQPFSVISSEKQILKLNELF